MEKFKIEIKETLSKIIEVEADNVGDAIYKTKKMYQEERIILDYENYIDTEIKELSE